MSIPFNIDRLRERKEAESVAWYHHTNTSHYNTVVECLGLATTLAGPSNRPSAVQAAGVSAAKLGFKERL